jgi:leader peptidase (prepilin peptidase)/N-methyltransferase
VSGPDIAVAAIAAIAGFAVSPYAQRLIESVPPDPEDDPPPVPRAAPWLARHYRLGILFAVVAFIVALCSGAEAATAAHVVTALGLTGLSVIDLDLFLLPRRFVWPLTGVVLALLGVAAIADGDFTSLKRAFVAGLASFGAFLVLNLINPRGMGFGDVRLSAVIGLDLGWLGAAQAMLGLFAGFVFGAVIGIALIVFKKKARNEAVPFGPFMALGAFFVLVGGDLLLGFTRG